MFCTVASAALGLAIACAAKPTIAVPCVPNALVTPLNTPLAKLAAAVPAKPAAVAVNCCFNTVLLVKPALSPPILGIVNPPMLTPPAAPSAVALAILLANAPEKLLKLVSAGMLLTAPYNGLTPAKSVIMSGALV